MLAQPLHRILLFALVLWAPTTVALADTLIDEKLSPLEHNNRGVVQGVNGNWIEAIEEAEAAVAAKPDNKAFRTNLSGAYLRYGDFLKKTNAVSAAMIQYRKALFVDPNNGVAEGNLNACYTSIGQHPSTLKCHADAARALEEVNDFKQAAAEYRACANIEDTGYNNFKLGQCLLKAGNREKAFYFLEYALMRPWLDTESGAKAECEQLFAQKN